MNDEKPPEDKNTLEVHIRRQWNDYRVGTVRLEDIAGMRWDQVSGGVQSLAPQPFIHGYVFCTDIAGEIAHSCRHGDGPHRIKVCVVKKDNSKEVWNELLRRVGPKPK